MMPAVVTLRQRSESEWNALKQHIVRERQKKKLEQEADAEVQRQKREREQKQKQDVMTLGETKEQITALEAKLSALTEEKHQLFLQLKKVLNEDDNRRRQAVEKESASEMMNVSVFLPQLQGRTPLYKVGSSAPSNTGPSVGTKRARSPSPPPTQIPTYHPYNYKSQSFHNKPEDGRRGHEYVRAVLWNKGPAVTYGGVYGVAPNQPVYSYSGTPAPFEPVYLPRSSYENRGESEKLYLRGQSTSLIPVHQPQAAKTGGISSGFPVRAPQQSHNVYMNQSGSSNSRLLYGAAPPTGRYPGPAPM